jgi:DNA-binding winged helix-turn-helix (wHTH) protein
MGMISSFSALTNPFTRTSFWGREKELNNIWGRLLSKPPQSVVVIGEPLVGKTRLVKHLIEAPMVDKRGKEYDITFIYLDCKRYIELTEDWYYKTQPDPEPSIEHKQRNMGNFAAARFWWDFYNALPRNLQKDEPFSEPRRNEDAAVLLDFTYEIGFEIEKWVQNHSQPVIFILDNFEGVARLPMRNSDRLRSLANYCGFVITSRNSLYVLYNYHQGSWAQPSPFYNIFSDTIYLGLLSEQVVSRYLKWATQEAEKSGSHWETQDTTFIRKMAGRHPELLRIACTRIFEERRLSEPSSGTEADLQDYQFLAWRLVQDGTTLCKELWEGLTKPELYGLVGIPGITKKEDSRALSPYQLTLIEISHGRTESDINILFELEQRGLIEGTKEKWRIFSEVMQQFVLMQEEASNQAKNDKSAVNATLSSDILFEREDENSLTYTEGKVYDYLKSHVDEVCNREEIMQSVWGVDNMPSKSALQKIIERIREKIEDDPDSPFRLIAVRGRGYMLRRVS